MTLNYREIGDALQIWKCDLQKRKNSLCLDENVETDGRLILSDVRIHSELTHSEKVKTKNYFLDCQIHWVIKSQMTHKLPIIYKKAKIIRKSVPINRKNTTV